MGAYGYPLPRRYRVRYPFKYRKGGSGSWPVAVVTGVVLLAAAGGTTKAVTSHGHPKAAPKPSATGNAAAAQVTAFARSKVGRVPYLWGGTTDAGMDCSGLAQSAYESAGISIDRTSQQQWASERHVTVPVAGDLVFFAGSDGTWSAPGHVGIVVDPARHLMIDEYGAGTYARYDGYGSAASPGTGLGAVVGFTDPAPQAPASPKPEAAPGAGEAGFIAAVLADLSAPDTGANQRSMAAWGAREGCWGCVGTNNQWDTTLPEPGSTWFNTFYSNGVVLHVQNYPTAAEGAQATAVTLEGGYPQITAALRSGAGLCGDPQIAGELLTWSGNGYSGVC